MVAISSSRSDLPGPPVGYAHEGVLDPPETQAPVDLFGPDLLDTGLLDAHLFGGGYSEPAVPLPDHTGLEQVPVDVDLYTDPGEPAPPAVRPAGRQVAVRVHARDPISQMGILSQLRPRREVRVTTVDEQVEVVLAITDAIDDECTRWLRSLRRSTAVPMVLVIGQVDPRALVAVVQSGVCGMLRRGEATPERLVRLVEAAARGQVEFPPELLKYLVDHVSRLNENLLEPRGLTFAGLTARERDVLRLLAEGLSTKEVADRLAYSERTIKSVVQDLTIRLHLRNRTQVVAYAVRNGWI